MLIPLQTVLNTTRRDRNSLHCKYLPLFFAGFAGVKSGCGCGGISPI